MMRKILYMLIAMALTVAACSSSGSGGGGPQVGTAACENDAQKQFVLDAHVADALVVVARTGGGEGDRDGLTLFLVDA